MIRSLTWMQLVLAAVLLWLPTTSPRADDRPIVAVFEIENRGSRLKGKVLGNLTVYLATRLAEGGYQVIPQDQIKSRLRSQKMGSYKSCFDQTCQIELSPEMGELVGSCWWPTGRRW